MNTYPKFLASLTRPFAIIALLVALLGSAVFVIPASAASITVNTTADENGTGASCSLREAITAANTNAAFGGCPAGTAGADTITLPAGTYTLSITNVGGVNEDSNATGDLDVLDSLTIQGAGSGSTIIQAGTSNGNGIDKVLALNPKCTSAINVTIDGVTVRFGRNIQPAGAPDFSFTGGGIDWCSAGSGGTFTLSNSVVSDNTTVNGYGGGLNVDTVASSSTTVNITNVTFSNNQTLSTIFTANGGAINLFGDSPTVSITNSTFTGNLTTNPTSGGGAIYFRPTTVGHLSISGSTFSSNTAAGIGGAIATDSRGAGTTISIQNSTFTGNTATNSFGGALDLDGTNVNSTPFSLTHLSITGNTAGISGGGIFVGNSNVSMSKSLIVGNTAPDGKGIHKSVDATTATVTNNWWGCSTGPSAFPCDTATTAGGTLSFTPWYRDQLTATTSPIVTNQSTSLTASFLTNSATTAVPVADLAEIIGRSVAWAATHGNLSSTQGTIQAAGTATGSFQATSTGTAVISAKVDNDNTSPVSSNVVSLTVNKADTTAAITNDAALSSTTSVTGQPVTVTYSVTGAFGNSPTAPTGNVTVSDGVDSCIGTAAAGTCNIAFTSIGAKTLTATYGGDSNFNASPASASASHTVNKADTTLTITSDSPDPSVVGQSVTVDYSVTVNSPGGGTPTGNVTVSDGTLSCTATVAAGTCSITFTSAGSRSLTATYGGDANYNASPASVIASHTVNAANTTTAITSDNPDPSGIGQAVTVNFTVAVTAPGAGTPTGNVTVSDGVDSCIGTVSAGTCSISLTTSGARTLTAIYAGDSNFNGSTSAGEPHTVNGQATTTTITSDSPDPSVVGQSVTVQYSVTPSGSGTPTGNVTVSDGTVSCTGTVAAGQCSITFTSAGAKSLTATYAGDSNFNGSSSAAEAHQVNRADTTTTITSDNPDPSAVSVLVTVQYNVGVNAPGAGTPAGIVTVSDGTISCTGIVSAGQCSLTFTTGGVKSLTATYSGDSNFNGSTSAVESHSVLTPPAVTINQASLQSDPTGTSPIHFTAVFGHAVSGFTGSDVSLGGTALPTIASVTQLTPNDGTTYDVAVSGMTANGMVTASIPANAAQDAAGNGNLASSSTDNTVTFNLDSTPPDTFIDSSPSDPSNSTSASFSFHGSDDITPAASLTFECQLDGGGFSACTSPKNYSGLGLGSHTFQVRAIDAATNVDPSPASFTWQIHAVTSLLYNGNQIVNIGFSFTPAALLSSPVPACTVSQTISFSLDANPLTGAVGSYLLGSAVTNSSGQASLAPVGTAGWLEGVYSLTASFAGTSTCAPATDQVTLTVASPGESANGGGWYTLSGSGRINFGFTVRKTDGTCTVNCTYKGRLLLINNGKWRLKGTLDTFSKLSTGQGAASGIGDLYWWNSSLNGGLGDWVLAKSGVSFTINFYDNGKAGKAIKDSFGINIQYLPVPPQPGTLPNSSSQLLKGGDIKVQ